VAETNVGATPGPDSGQAEPENPLEHPAVQAHSLIARGLALFEEAKGIVEQFLPASAVNAIEQTGIQDAEQAIKTATGQE